MEKRDLLKQNLLEYREKIIKINLKYDEEISKEKINFEKQLEDLNKKFEDQFLKIDNEEINELSNQINRYSPKLLNLREIEKKMLKTKKYKEAASIKETADLLENKEKLENNKKFHEYIKNKRDLIKSDYNLHFSCLEQKLDRKIQSIESNRSLDISNHNLFENQILKKIEDITKIIQIDISNYSFNEITTPKILSSRSLKQKKSIETQTNLRYKFPKIQN